MMSCLSKNWKYDKSLDKEVNRLCREEMKLKLLADIRIDLQVCELEGWDKLEYLSELKEIIDGFMEDKK